MKTTINDAPGAAPDRQLADATPEPIRAAVTYGRAPSPEASRSKADGPTTLRPDGGLAHVLTSKGNMAGIGQLRSKVEWRRDSDRLVCALPSCAHLVGLPT